MDETDLIGLTAGIVSAYVAKNAVRSTEVPDLIASVHASLAGLGKPVTEPKQAQVPAVPIKKSITPDYIISLEDGTKYKSLKRHLSTKYNMTPDEYRTKWGLPPDYPMVAPNYAATRSELARSIGLGQLRRKEKAAPPPPASKSRRSKTASAAGQDGGP